MGSTSRRENFIEASLEKMEQLSERPLSELRLCTVLIDATPLKDRRMIAALGIGWEGRKTVWPRDVSSGPAVSKRSEPIQGEGMPIPVVIVATRSSLVARSMALDQQHPTVFSSWVERQTARSVQTSRLLRADIESASFPS
jgi:hypothetical protein